MELKAKTAGAKHTAKLPGKLALINSIKSNLSAWLILLPSLLIIAFIQWRPIIAGTALSLFDLKGYTPVKFVGLQNYYEVLSDTMFLKTLWNTVEYVFWSIVLGYLPPIFIAIVLNEMIHFQKFFKFSIYFPVIVPSVASALIWYFLYQPDKGGILNMLRGLLGLDPFQWLQNAKYTIPLIVLAMTWRGFGATMIMYLASLQGVSQELYESARIDGANISSRIWNITFPQISGVMLLLFIKQVIGVFQVMVEPMAMTGGGPNNASMTLALQGYNYAFVYFQPDKALALGVVTAVLLVVMTIFYFAINKRVGND